MLTRRHIRVKAMQSIYAMLQSKNTNLDNENKFLSVSINNMYNLYLILIGLLIEIRQKSETIIDISKKKYLATNEEINPNVKFINNKVLKMLQNNILIKNEFEQKKLTNWVEDDEYVTIILEDIFQSKYYNEYMKKNETSFSDDKKFLIDVYKNVIAHNDKLYEYIEDNNLTWLDDLPLVNTLIVKILKKTNPDSESNHFLPKLYKDEEDKIFSKELFNKTILNDEKLQAEISGKTPNWDTERIAEVDSILLKMAVCEFLNFPSIPIKVTINEYLEIAKEYSTPKSSVFINGILDKLVKEYEIKKMLNKSGRGLM